MQMQSIPVQITPFEECVFLGCKSLQLSVCSINCPNQLDIYVILVILIQFSIYETS